MQVRPGKQDFRMDSVRMLNLTWTCGLALLLLVWWVVMHRYLQRHYKGPKTWPILGCFVEQARNFEIMHDWLLAYFQQGILTLPVPIVVANNTITADPANVEYILKSNFVNYPKGELLRERFQEILGHGIFNVDGDMWRHQRKMVTLEFASSKLRDISIHAYRAEALRLVQVLASTAKGGKSVDLQDCFMRLTLDSICKVGFGVDIGSLSPEFPALPFANAFDESNRLIVARYIDVFWKLKRALNIGAEARLRHCVHVVNSFIYEVINKRRVEMKSESALNQAAEGDILSRFMLNVEGESKAYSDERLRDIVINFIIAGRDTTAITLSWFFYELCRNPRVVDNIRAEAATVLGIPDELPAAKDFQSSGYGDRILDFTKLLTFQNMSKLQYLHAALTEALRLYPAVPMETKVAAENDTFPDGTRIKRGQYVTYSSYSMGRLECIWGPDALEFKPERWLKNGIYQPVSPFKLTAFQAGPRICLGKDSAYLQMKLTAVLLLKFFTFELLDERPPKYMMMVVLFIANGLRVRLSQR